MATSDSCPPCDDSGFDLLAHHGAYVTDYRSPDFDFAAALASNTRNLPAVVEAAKAGGVKRLLITGSVFEGAKGPATPDCLTSPRTASPKR